MPSYTRQFLRRQLGESFLRDTLVGSSTGSWGATASLTVMDSAQADEYVVSEQLFNRSWLRAFYGPTPSPSAYKDARVATFNTLSGAWMCLVTAPYAVTNNSWYEVHSILPPAEKDQVIDDVIDKLRVRQEVVINAAQRTYSLGPNVVDVLNARIMEYPPASRNFSDLQRWEMVTTVTGQELRVEPTLTASQQLAVEAIMTLTWVPDGVNGTDRDTITVPDLDWLLSGAAARAYWILEARAPAQEVARFKDRRREMAAQFSRLSARYQPHANREIGRLE